MSPHSSGSHIEGQITILPYLVCVLRIYYLYLINTLLLQILTMVKDELLLYLQDLID